MACSSRIAVGRSDREDQKIKNQKIHHEDTKDTKESQKNNVDEAGCPHAGVCSANLTAAFARPKNAALFAVDDIALLRGCSSWSFSLRGESFGSLPQCRHQDAARRRPSLGGGEDGGRRAQRGTVTG
jgi:hypothetical protein